MFPGSSDDTKSVVSDSTIASGDSNTPAIHSKMQSFQISTGEITVPKVISNKETKIFGGSITLNPDITPLNFYASLVHVIIVQFNHTVTSTLQPLIITDPDSYNADRDSIGIILAKLMILQTVTKMCLTPLYGYLMDRIGRKPMVIIGGFMALTGYLLVPFQKSVFPGYAISKILVANGGNMMTLAPFVADYVHDSSKGKAMGITTALGSAGQLFGAAFVSVLLAAHVSLKKIHVIIGITIISVVLVYSIGIKGGKYYLLLLRKNSDDEESTPIVVNYREEKFFTKLAQGFKVLGQNGWLLISLSITILARADYYLVTIMFALFIKSFDKVGDTEAHDESNKMVSHYQTLFFSLSLVGNLAYGHILDKVNTLYIIFPTCTAAMIGYLLGSFSDSKESILLLLLILLAGVAMPGLLNSGNYLAMKYFPRELRGLLNSMMSVIGVAGYLFLSTAGGYLFDNYGKASPFLLFVGMLAATMAAIFFIYKTQDLGKGREKEKEEILKDQPEHELDDGDAI